MYILYRIVFIFLYVFYNIYRLFINDDYNNSRLSNFILKVNNKFALIRLKRIDLKSDEIAILLPHCIQDYNCTVKITSDIENCNRCGKCAIDKIINLKEKYNLKVKVATGGTLARIYLKKIRPKFVIAVACERDLISGLFDSFPLIVYGVFNKRVNGPCYNTKINFEELEEILQDLEMEAKT